MDESKRKQYIRVLRIAANHADDGMITVSVDEVREIIDLLTEQEPRVLSKSEAEQYVTHGITDGYSETPPLYVEYQKPQRYYLKWVTLETAYSWMTDYGTSSVYGSELRFWTSRPTPEQMRDTPWEGDSDAEIH